MLFKQGAILFAKSNMHELALGSTSANPTFGYVKNPYDLSRIPGGSSGGTAAAVAARIVPAGLGSDTTGSVRMQGNESRLTRLCLQWAESVQQVLRVPGGTLAAALD